MINKEHLDFLYQQANNVINTNWFVITGPPSSGKTTLIKELSKVGYKVNPDLSRQVIENLMAKGLTLEQIYQKEEDLQNQILNEMITISRTLSLREIIFHDYSFPDNIPFLKLASIEIAPEFEIAARLYNFKGVFICDPLRMELDNIRKETIEDQFYLLSEIKNYYAELGYKCIHLPAISVESRMELILRHINFAIN